MPFASTDAAAGTTHTKALDIGYASTIAVLSQMIDGLPEYSRTLEGTTATEFAEARAVLEIALAAWRRGDASVRVQRLNPENYAHPVVILLRHLDSMPDEPPPPRPEEIPFVEDEALRDCLARDIASAERALQDREWKAATVLAGSVVEALLLAAIETERRDRIVDAEEATPARGAGRVARAIEKWDLAELVAEAKRVSLLTATTVAQCEIARGFRNLIHPGRERRLEQECTRGTALSAAAAVHHVLGDLQRAQVARCAVDGARS